MDETQSAAKSRQEEPRREAPQTFAAAFRALATWKKVACALAILLVIAGVVLQLTTGSGGEPTAGTESGAVPGVGNSFLPGGTQGPEGASEGTAAGGAGGAADWSPTMVKLGFGFVAGLAIGLFLRNFLRLSLAFVGLILLAILGLEFVGFLTVEWDSMKSGFDSLKTTLADDLEGFKTFVQGRIPAAGSSLVGFYAGFRRG